MFSFFAWLSLIGGIISAAINFIRYSNIEDPLLFTNGLVYLIMAFVSFAVYRRLSHMEQEIDYHKQDIKNLYSRMLSNGRIERKDDSKNIEEIKNQIEHNLRQKYEDHIITVTNRISAESFSKSDIRSEIFAPKDWAENASGSRATWYAQYKYYEDVFLLVNKSKKTEDIAVEVCEEAYRLVGFLGINLNGQNSEILSWYCDHEQKIYGKSARLRTMCQKLDSIGLLDRGRPFGDRLN